MTITRTLATLPLLLLLAGCASTPEKRIQQNQTLFDTLPADAQIRIRGGQIDIGFSPDMVRLALGTPHRTLTRRSPAGESDVWLYLDVVRRYERQRTDIDGLSLSGSGGVRSIGGSAWIQIAQEREFVRTRVEFLNGVVFALEETSKEPPKP